MQGFFVWYLSVVQFEEEEAEEASLFSVSFRHAVLIAQPPLEEMMEVQP
jgi:hypothetical protein